ncbi:GntR family transcriptional regulator [Desulfofustis glycolicus]|uniref:DNA-binding transcriptional regulator, GntR family n=1 Tax=Desulfofustis glycolicus DSM 9705 TaxID=1121409 RepID=A0A1M5RYT5_9BACT|nr:GntR family transcriptional regulator [Desulfofustis glycolicus]MCB2216313.1 GntR family transcriptional regulator [Desulfobulbaceae bacterium]SHH31406.1 DNA-binding transcriptional regulator, GntR family [Desulfofustis glycolicus DSM 9705]
MAGHSQLSNSLPNVASSNIGSAYPRVNVSMYSWVHLACHNVKPFFCYTSIFDMTYQINMLNGKHKPGKLFVPPKMHLYDKDNHPKTEKSLDGFTTTVFLCIHEYKVHALPINRWCGNNESAGTRWWQDSAASVKTTLGKIVGTEDDPQFTSGQRKTTMKNKGWDNGLLQVPKTMSEQVYDLLRTKILHQEINPGEVLLEVAVSEALGVSRTPVREAFRLLQHDALVIKNPRGGVKVTELTLEELVEVSNLRLVFETYSIQLTCDRISTKEIGILEDLIREVDQIFSESGSGRELDLIRLAELNTKFHDILYEAAGSHYLKRILEIIRLPIMRYRPFSLETPKQRERSWTEHKQMIKLLKEKDKNGLKKLMRKHVKDASDAIAKKLEHGSDT